MKAGNEERRRVSYFLGLGAKGSGNGSDEQIPFLRLLAQMLAASRSEFVELGAAIVVGNALVSLQKSPMHEPKQRGIERALFDDQDVPGNLLDAQKNAVAMERAERNCFQNEGIESAGKKLRLGAKCPPKTIRRLGHLS